MAWYSLRCCIAFHEGRGLNGGCFPRLGRRVFRIWLLSIYAPNYVAIFNLLPGHTNSSFHFNSALAPLALAPPPCPPGSLADVRRYACHVPLSQRFSSADSCAECTSKDNVLSAFRTPPSQPPPPPPHSRPSSTVLSLRFWICFKFLPNLRSCEKRE